MELFLDYIRSESWAFFTVFTAMCFLPTLMLLWRPFRNIYVTRTVQVAAAVFAFSGLMYILLGPSGYAVQYIGGLTNGKELCLVEFHYSGDGDGGTYDEYRLYVFDFATGEYKFRRSVESDRLMCVKENSVIFFLWDSAEEYDLNTGKTIRTWSMEEGFENYPQLKCGISNMNCSGGAYDFINEGWLTITAKDGHQYCYNLKTDELIEAEYPPSEPEGPYKVDEYQVQCKDNYGSAEWTFDFQDKTGELKALVYHDKNYQETQLEGEYLGPEMVSIHPDQKLFVFKHYNTTEHTSAIHTAVGFDSKIKWNLTQQDLQTRDKITDQPLPGISMPVDDKLILTFGGMIVCVNAADGKVIWKSVK